MFCTNCGSKTDANDKFCTSCGAAKAQDAATSYIPNHIPKMAASRSTNKNSIIITCSVLAVIVLISVISLQRTPSYSIVGTWEIVDITAPNIYEFADGFFIGMVDTFNRDGTGFSILNDEVTEFEWTINGNRLTLTAPVFVNTNDLIFEISGRYMRQHNIDYPEHVWIFRRTNISGIFAARNPVIEATPLPVEPRAQLPTLMPTPAVAVTPAPPAAVATPAPAPPAVVATPAPAPPVAAATPAPPAVITTPTPQPLAHQVIPTVSWHWSNYGVSVGGWNVSVQYFESPVVNSVHFTLEFEYTAVHEGNPFGLQRVYVLEGGIWIAVGTFYVSGFEQAIVPINLGRRVTIEGIAVVPGTPLVGQAHFNFRYSARDFIVE